MALIILFAGSPAFAAEPTLDETLKWVQEKLTTRYRYQCDAIKVMCKVTSRLEKWNGCNVVFRKHLSCPRPGFEEEDTTYAVNLRDVRSAVAVKGSEEIRIWIEAESESIAYSKKSAWNYQGQQGQEDKKGQLKELVLTFSEATDSNAQMAGRIVKALHHTARLCGGMNVKPEPF